MMGIRTADGRFYLCYNNRMADPQPVDSPTVRLHKRQLAWQILVPFLILAVLILAAAVWVISGAASGTRVWADVSIIWMLFPLLIFALFSIFVLGFLIYAIARLIQVTPHYTARVQFYSTAAAIVTRKVADGAAKPFFWIRQAGAVIKSLFHKP